MRLLALSLAGRKNKAIAAELGRAHTSILSRLKTLKLPSRAAVAIAPLVPAGRRGARKDIKNGGLGEQKQRVCLTCLKTFLSAHAGNRRCRSCERKVASITYYAAN